MQPIFDHQQEWLYVIQQPQPQPQQQGQQQGHPRSTRRPTQLPPYPVHHQQHHQQQHIGSLHRPPGALPAHASRLPPSHGMQNPNMPQAPASPQPYPYPSAAYPSSPQPSTPPPPPPRFLAQRVLQAGTRPGAALMPQSHRVAVQSARPAGQQAAGGRPPSWATPQAVPPPSPPPLPSSTSMVQTAGAPAQLPYSLPVVPTYAYASQQRAAVPGGGMQSVAEMAKMQHPWMSNPPAWAVAAGTPPKALQGQADATLKRIQSDLVQKGQHVSCSKLIKELCMRWGRLPDTALGMLGLDDWFKLPYLALIRDWEVSVNLDIECYARGFFFAASMENLKFTIDYLEDAHKGTVEKTLGPLVQHPRVQKLLNLDPSRLHTYKQVSFEDCITALQHLWTKRKGPPSMFNIMNELTKMKNVASPGQLCVRLQPSHIGAVFQKFKSAAGGCRDLREGQIEIMEERMQEANKPEAIISSGGLGHAPARRLDCTVQLGISGTVVHESASVPATQLGSTVQQLFPAQAGHVPQPDAQPSTQLTESGGGGASSSLRPHNIDEVGLGMEEEEMPTAMSMAAMRLRGAGRDGNAADRTRLLHTTAEAEEELCGAEQPLSVAVSVKDLVQAVKQEARSVSISSSGGGGSGGGAEYLGALADLEQRVLLAFSCGSSAVAAGGFAALTGGQYSSLLALLATQPQLAQELPQLFLPGTGAPSTSSMGLVQATAGAAHMPALLPVAVEQAARAWDKAAGSGQQPPQAKEADVAAALCAQFGVSLVEDLGCGPVRQLLEDWAGGETSSGVVAACALTCGADGVGAARQPLSPLGIRETEVTDAALAALASAPELADLEEWSQWELAFGPVCGPLHGSGLLRQAAHFSSDERSSSGSAWIALALPGGRTLKVPAPRVGAHSQLVGAFEEGMQQLDSVAVVGAALGLVATRGSCAGSVLQALVEAGTSALADAAGQAQGSSVPCTPEQAHKLCVFVLDCLCLLPRTLRPHMAAAVLEPLVHVLGPEMPDILLAHARKAAMSADGSGMQALMHLGLALHVPPWLECYKEQVIACTEGYAEPGMDACEHVQLPQQSQQVPGSLLQPPSGDEAAEGAMREPNTQVSSTCLAPSPSLAALAEPQVVIDLNEGKAHAAKICKKWDHIAAVDADHVHGVARSMQSLGPKAYTENSHFMQELIQNANDNTYTESSPWIGFEVTSDMIHVANNEVGFTHRSMEKMCSLCGSEKQEDKIGNKGIGFKSVYKITHSPFIYSNAYQVKFDVSANEIGYLTPIWVEDPLPPDLCLGHGCRTHFLLPLLPSLQGETVGGHQLRASLRETPPELMVFLDTLQRLTLVDRVVNLRIDLERRITDDGLVEVIKRTSHPASDGRQSTVQIHRYVKVKESKQLDPPIERRPNKKWDKTFMELAFKLPDHSSSREEPVEHMAYAFLPMKKYGLRMLLNADFETVTSREGIDEGNLYNQATLTLFPGLVLKAFAQLQSMRLQPGSEHSGLDWWLKCLPREQDLRDQVFSRMTTTLIERVQVMRCIPTEDNQWVQPIQAAVCTDLNVADLLAALRSHGLVDKNLVHPSLTALYADARAADLRQQLGVQRLSTEQLPLYAEAVCKQPGLIANLGHPWVARLLLCVMRIPQPQQRSAALDKLSRLPMLKLLGSDAYVAAAGVVPQPARAPGSPAQQQPMPLFFPLCEGGTWNGIHVLLSSGVTGLTAEMLPLPQLDPVLLQQVSSTEGHGHAAQQLRSGLGDMGVREMQLSDVLEWFVLPLFEWHKQQLKQGQQDQQDQQHQGQRQQDEELVAALRFVVFSGQLQNEAVCKRVKACAVVVTTQGRRLLSATSPVYIPCSLGNGLDLQAQFPSVTWTLVSEAYAQGGQGSGGGISAAQWLEALTALGAHTWLPLLQCPPAVMSEAEVLARALVPAHAQAACSGARSSSSSNSSRYEAQDLACPEFERIVDELCRVSSHKRMQQQLLLLQKLMAQKLEGKEYRDALAVAATLHSSHSLDGRRGGKNSCSVDSADAGIGSSTGVAGAPEGAASDAGEVRSIMIHSRFARSLRDSPWLLSNEGEAKAPNELFLKENFMKLLSDKVAYLHPQTAAHRALLDLGVHQQPSMPLVLELLKSWAGQESSPGLGNSFQTSVREMYDVYHYLVEEATHNGNKAQELLVDAFNSAPLLWLPPKEAWRKFKPHGDTAENNRMPGAFYSTKMARLNDNAHVIEAISWDAQRLRIIGLYYRSKKAGPFSCPLYHPSNLSMPSGSPDNVKKGVCSSDQENDQEADDDGTKNIEAGRELSLRGKQPLVKSSPSMAEYVAALEVLKRRNPNQANKEDNGFISKIFDTWNQWASPPDSFSKQRMSPEDVDELRTLLHSGPSVFPTIKGGWASLQDALYVNDNKELAAQLGLTEEPIHFFKMQYMPHFFEAIRMPTLRMSLAPLGLPEGVPASASEEATAACRKALSCMQRWMFYKEKVDYASLESAGVARVLPILSAVVVQAPLRIRMQLLGPRGPAAEPGVQTCKASLVMGTSTVCLYVEGSNSAQFDAPAVAHELSRLSDVGAMDEIGRHKPLRWAARPNSTVAALMARVLALPGGNDMETLMKDQGLPPLPEDVPLWVEGQRQPPHAGSVPQASPAAKHSSPGVTSSSSSTNSPAKGQGRAQALGLVPGGSTKGEALHHVSVPGVPLAPCDANKVIKGEALQEEVWLRADLRRQEKQRRLREQQLSEQQGGQRAAPGGTRQREGSGPHVVRYITPDDQLAYVHERVVRASQSGAVGEEAAVYALLCQLKDHEVRWVNQEEEGWKPYDIIVKPPLDEAARASGKPCTFVEVKSTTAAAGGHDEFDFSAQQMEVAATVGRAYEVHRVYDVFGKPEVVRLIDPMEMWRRKEIRMRCIVQQQK